MSDPSFLSELQNEIDPVESDIAEHLKHQLMLVYSAVKYHGLYISNEQIEFTDHGDPIRIIHLPSAIISANLVNKSSTLISGASGSGKTATIRYIDRLINGSSISQMKNIIHCDKEIQKEDWLAFLNPKKIIRGEGGWKIEWAEWTDGYTLIIDEVRRANANLQNALLLLMNDGRIQYGVKFSKQLGEFRLFMTDNPTDTLIGDTYGTALSNAFLDRITQRIIVESPKGWAMRKFSERREDERGIFYNDDNIIAPIMTRDEVRAATILAAKMPVDPDAEEFARNLSKNADFCIRAPLYTKSLIESIRPSEGLCEGCDFRDRGIYCRSVFGGSMRMYKDLLSMGKAYAFWLNLKSVTKHLIHAIAPDIIAHRLHVHGRALREDKGNTFGNTYAYIKKNYIDVEFSRLPKRMECTRSFYKLIYGKGTKKDLDRIKNYANEDLSVRIEMLPMVTIGIDITRNVHDSGNTELYSCLNEDYVNFMKKVNSAYKRKDKETLVSLLNECGLSPMGNLLQDIIHSYLHKLDMKEIAG